MPAAQRPGPRNAGIRGGAGDLRPLLGPRVRPHDPDVRFLPLVRLHVRPNVLEQEFTRCSETSSTFVAGYRCGQRLRRCGCWTCTACSRHRCGTRVHASGHAGCHAVNLNVLAALEVDRPWCFNILSYVMSSIGFAGLPPAGARTMRSLCCVRRRRPASRWELASLFSSFWRGLLLEVGTWRRQLLAAQDVLMHWPDNAVLC